MGFLHSTVKDHDKTRWEEYEERHGEPPQTAQIDAGHYIWQAWQDLGLVSVGMAAQPLNWSEIDAFARMTGDIQPGMDAKIIRDMSKAYLVWKQRGTDALCVSPVEG